MNPTVASTSTSGITEIRIVTPPVAPTDPSINTDEEVTQIQNTIQKVFVQNNMENSVSTPPSPTLATYLAGTELETTGQEETVEDPLALPVTDELVDLSFEYGGGLFPRQPLRRLPRRSSSFQGVYTESPAEKPLSPRPSTSASGSRAATKRPKTSRDFDPDFEPGNSDFDPNSRVKAKSSKRAPAKSSRNRKPKEN